MVEKLDQDALRCHIEKSVQDLPAMPEVVTRVVELTDNPESAAAELQQVVSNDQALVGKILRVVNSAYYGTPSTVTSINHAVMILGMRQLRNLVLSLAAMSLVKARAPYMMEYQRAFWRHSLGVGSAAVSIARKRKVESKIVDDLFTGGLLHDVGRLFLLGYFYPSFVRATEISEIDGVPLWKVEQGLLGMNHTEIGGMLAEKWNFPPALSAMIRYHHGPLPEDDLFVPVACVHLGDYVMGRIEEKPEYMMESPDDRAMAWADFGEPEVEEIIASVRENIKDAEELLGMMPAA